MKALMWFFAITPCLAAVIVDGWMAINHIEGWGWAFLVACIIYPTIKDE